MKIVVGNSYWARDGCIVVGQSTKARPFLVGEARPDGLCWGFPLSTQLTSIQTDDGSYVVADRPQVVDRADLTAYHGSCRRALEEAIELLGWTIDDLGTWGVEALERFGPQLLDEVPLETLERAARLWGAAAVRRVGARITDYF